MVEYTVTHKGNGEEMFRLLCRSDARSKVVHGKNMRPTPL